MRPCPTAGLRTRLATFVLMLFATIGMLVISANRLSGQDNEALTPAQHLEQALDKAEHYLEEANRFGDFGVEEAYAWAHELVEEYRAISSSQVETGHIGSPAGLTKRQKEISVLLWELQRTGAMLRDSHHEKPTIKILSAVTLSRPIQR